MPQRLTTELFVDRARKVHSDVYDYSEVEYVGSFEKVTIICPKHGAFQQMASSHLRGQGCKLCGCERSLRTKMLSLENGKSGRRSPKYTTEEFVDKARESHGGFYDYSKTKYVNGRTKVIITCPIHGDFLQLPRPHLSGHGCARCRRLGVNVADARLGGRQTFEDFVVKAMLRHGYFYDYSKVDYVNSTTKICIVCPVHGDFWQMPYRHVVGDGCPTCAAHRRVGYNGSVVVTTERFIERACEIHGDFYDYSNVDYVDTRTKVTIVCPKHGPFQQTPFSHLQGCGCPECGFHNSHSAKQSKPEEALFQMLCSRFGPSDIRRQYKSDRYPFFCDFYVVSRDLYIELNAFWVHGKHWYDITCDADNVRLRELQEKANMNLSMYQSAVHTWVVRDKFKRDTARANNLNYVVFWDNDLADAHRWFEFGCPDGKDWDCEYSWCAGV